MEWGATLLIWHKSPLEKPGQEWHKRLHSKYSSIVLILYAHQVRNVYDIGIFCSGAFYDAIKCDQKVPHNAYWRPICWTFIFVPMQTKTAGLRGALWCYSQSHCVQNDSTVVLTQKTEGIGGGGRKNSMWNSTTHCTGVLFASLLALGYCIKRIVTLW